VAKGMGKTAVTVSWENTPNLKSETKSRFMSGTSRILNSNPSDLAI
jgi:hypothetical protein